MVDIVNNLGEAYRHGQRAVWGQWMVETTGFLLEKDGNGGVIGTETILGG